MNGKFLEKVEQTFGCVPEIIEKAYNFATKMHHGVKRVSGEPYIIHPIAVATILMENGFDEATISAGLLHDVVEDTPVSYKQITEMFGLEIQKLVKAVSKIKTLKTKSKEILEMETFKRMFIAMSKDIRVIVIKLADRLHNIRTCDVFNRERKIKFCNQTMQVFVPIAERLGLDKIKLEMEDTCFKYLHEEEYKQLKQEFDKKKERYQVIMKNIKQNIDRNLKKNGYEAKCETRFKHLFKMHRVTKNRGTDKVQAIMGFKIISPTVEDCYKILGIVHQIYRPLPGCVKDYIGSQKVNFYQSLNTTLINKDGIPFEVEIRTQDMDDLCEYGIVAHYRDKTDDQKKKILDQYIKWARRVVQEEKQIKDGVNFVKELKKDFQTSEIWVFTPKYTPVSLPEGATPIDFAYSIHTELGNSCIGAIVDGKRVSLSYELQTGEVVEIIKTKEPKGPARDWLNIVVSRVAKNNIRKYFNNQISPEKIDIGKQILENALVSHGLKVEDLYNDQILTELKKKYFVHSFEDVFATITAGGIKASSVVSLVKLMSKTKEEKEVEEYNFPITFENNLVVNDVKMAKCCLPVYGDKIVGGLGNGGITVHRCGCSNLNGGDSVKHVEIEWKENISQDFETMLKIVAKDRQGILSDILEIVYARGIDVSNVHARKSGDKFESYVSIIVKNNKEIKDLVDSIKQITDIKSIARNSAI